MALHMFFFSDSVVLEDRKEAMMPLFHSIPLHLLTLPIRSFLPLPLPLSLSLTHTHSLSLSLVFLAPYNVI